MTKLIGVRSGQILLRLSRINQASSGSYSCEVQTKDPAYKYTSVKEMFVPDLTARREKIVAVSSHKNEKIIAQPSHEKEDLVAQPSPLNDSISVEPPQPKVFEIDTNAVKPSRANRSLENSAVAIGICALVAVSINYVARAVTFLK